MNLVPGTRFRAKQNYEDRKEKWLLQITSDKELTAGDLRTGVALSKYMNRKERLVAWPGYARLTKDTGLCRCRVIRGVKKLEGRKHMRVSRSRSGSKNDVNHYHPKRVGDRRGNWWGGDTYDTR